MCKVSRDGLVSVRCFRSVLESSNCSCCRCFKTNICDQVQRMPRMPLGAAICFDQLSVFGFAADRYDRCCECTIALLGWIDSRVWMTSDSWGEPFMLTQVTRVHAACTLGTLWPATSAPRLGHYWPRLGHWTHLATVHPGDRSDERHSLTLV